VTPARSWRRRVLVGLMSWLRILLRTAWQSPVDHPREAALILYARMAVLFGTATIAVALVVVIVVLGRAFR
jgi:hypothetical protein